MSMPTQEETDAMIAQGLAVAQAKAALDQSNTTFTVLAAVQNSSRAAYDAALSAGESSASLNTKFLVMLNAKLAADQAAVVNQDSSSAYSALKGPYDKAFAMMVAGITGD